MLSDFKMITHDFGSEDITIIPISDVHLGAPQCKEKEFRKFIEWVAETPNVYITLGGDLINNSLRNSIANPFDELYRPREQKMIMAEILYPAKHKILCAVGGNHEARSIKDSDTDITLDIMSRLDIEHLYRPNMAFMFLRMNRNEDGTQKNIGSKVRPTYTIGVTHGAGGGVKMGGAVNKNVDFGNVIDGLDALIVGHTHKPIVATPSKMRVNIRGGTVDIVPFYVVISTSWLEYGGYALQKMLLPASNNLSTLNISAMKKQMNVTI